MEVRNKEGEVVAVIDVVTAFNHDRKNYDDCAVVVQCNIHRVTFEQVVCYILDYFNRHPDCVQKANESFKFAFPYYGGQIIDIVMTGSNFDDSAWRDFSCVVTDMFLKVLQGHYQHYRPTDYVTMNNKFEKWHKNTVERIKAGIVSMDNIIASSEFVS